MVALNSNSLCEKAEPYYYDILRKIRSELIPDPIIEHVEQCQHCQEQMDRLEGVLSQAGGRIESEEKQVSSFISVMLALHFPYVGKPVTCQSARPFLPSLLDPAIQIRIPTPITTHVDHCRHCSEDLKTIRGLNLNLKQLRRLSLLFADEPQQHSSSKFEMKKVVRSVAAMDFSGIAAEALKHLCKCSACRDMLCEERQKIHDSLPKYSQSPEFPCELMSVADIFDYVVPYGLDPADDQYAKFRESLTSHLRICRNCHAKMQHLHNTVYEIIGRPNPGVITIYRIDKSAKAQAPSGPDDIYAGFPIRVEVESHEEAGNAGLSASTVDFTAALKQKVSAKKSKPFAKIAVAVAVVILIALGLHLSIPAAKAVTIDQIYKAIEKAKNVYIAKFVPGQTEAIQEKWTSRELNIYITKTKNQSVLWDITNGMRKSRQLDTGAFATTQLTADEATNIKGKIRGSIGLTPFYDISKMLASSEWKRVDDENVEISEGIETYDLTWVERAHDGSAVLKKWRVFVHSKSNLPKKIEWYRKSASDSGYVLDTVMVVEYLGDSEMRAVIKEASF